MRSIRYSESILRFYYEIYCFLLIFNSSRKFKRVMSAMESLFASEASWYESNFLDYEIETFSIKTWFGKPEELSPLECARYGWINNGKDLLKCEVYATSCCGYDIGVWHKY